MKDNIAWVVGIITAIAGIISSFLAYRSGIIAESKKEGIQVTGIKKDIAHIKTDTEEIKKNMKEIALNVSAWTERIVKLEEKTRGIEKRVDALERYKEIKP